MNAIGSFPGRGIFRAGRAAVRFTHEQLLFELKRRL
jgi:hypothetical protein